MFIQFFQHYKIMNFFIDVNLGQNHLLEKMFLGFCEN